MFTSYESLYPLAKVSRCDFAKLVYVLWGWNPCDDWTGEHACRHSEVDDDCHYEDAERLRFYFDFYKDVTACYIPDLASDYPLAIQTHDDFIAVIRYIKNHIDKPRQVLTIEHFGIGSTAGQTDAPSHEHDRAINLAIRVMNMLQCSIEGQSDGLLETGMQPAIWYSDKSFNEFINLVIHRKDPLRLGPCNVAIPRPPRPTFTLETLAAKRLIKVAKLKIIPTNDLRDHLLLDRKNGTVAIFHYTSVLKEHLKSIGSSIEQHPGPPQKLMLETLHTLKYVLFPIDPESQTILRSLINKKNLDPDICRLDTLSWQSSYEEPSAYEYWGERLLDLYDELESPTPRGFLEEWMERKSGARYVMMATLAGVLIAILLGILSLAVSIFQAWVSWQQWKHPIS